MHVGSVLNWSKLTVKTFIMLQNIYYNIKYLFIVNAGLFNFLFIKQMVSQKEIILTLIMLIRAAKRFKIKFVYIVYVCVLCIFIMYT